ncbi:indeterminate(ID)-domain 11 [Striga asiatica]|uniref:Indeterminate(ID)-domain 11 n=1 Tax=Striga asiatica TaxID=4170 RepID=A0A5A7PAB8_STRAF|nr:indeterminate(ID)-domain 11 [Striga asiatica]
MYRRLTHSAERLAVGLKIKNKLKNMCFLLVAGLRGFGHWPLLVGMMCHLVLDLLNLGGAKICEADKKEISQPRICSVIAKGRIMRFIQVAWPPSSGSRLLGATEEAVLPEVLSRHKSIAISWLQPHPIALT